MKILLLEDNKTDVDLTLRGLTGVIPNCQVEVAQTLKEASIILEKCAAFDIAILDMMLPDGTGMDLLMEIRKSGIRMPVLILTGSGNEEVAAAAMKAGADDYIIKRLDYISKLPGYIDLAIQNHQQNRLLASEIIEVLYIEHHASDVDLTIRHMNQYAPQIHITILSSAEEALKLLPLNETEQTKFQVLILDYRLPGLNALEFTKIIRQERKLQIPVLLVTGQGNEEVAIQALKLGVNEYLVKRDNYLYRLPSLIMNTHQHYKLIQKQAELAKSETKYRLLAENSADVIFTTDLDLHYTYVSPSVYKLRGYNSEEVMQHTIEETLSPSSYATVIKVLSETMAELDASKASQMDPVMLDLEMKRKDGSMVSTEVKATVLFDENNQPVSILGVTRDITLKKKYELELIQAKEKAEESDRLKSAFLANMSHEIRTPMNGILGFAELLKEADLTSEKQQEYIRIIEKSGARMLNIINDIVDISKIESGQMNVSLRETNINEHMEFLADFFKTETENKQLQLLYKNTLSQKEAIIYTDSEKLYSILTNLVKNAIKFTNKGSIEFGVSILRNAHNIADSQSRQSELLFYVKDTGIGIPQARLEAIFERFIHADISMKQAYQGAGLGLAISKAYIEMLGGKIWVESKEGIGSTFYFTHPYKNESKDGNEIQITVEKKAVKKLKILIAEDDETSMELISIVAQKFGKEFIKVITGTEAVEACRNHPDIDLILLDILMPEMDGWEATRQIRKFNPDVIIIAQTAYGLVGDREKAMEVGCSDYISKPIKRDKLVEIIQKYF